jgi:hypothetical protein
MTSAALLQQASGRHVPMLKITARRHADYCARHQITYWALAGDVQFCRSPHWNKIALIQRALQQGFDTVAWLDADTLVIRESEDIRGALLPGAPLGMTILPSPGLPGNNHFNTGWSCRQVSTRARCSGRRSKRNSSFLVPATRLL